MDVLGQLIIDYMTYFLSGFIACLVITWVVGFFRYR